MRIPEPLYSWLIVKVYHCNHVNKSISKYTFKNEKYTCHQIPFLVHFQSMARVFICIKEKMPQNALYAVFWHFRYFWSFPHHQPYWLLINTADFGEMEIGKGRKTKTTLEFCCPTSFWQLYHFGTISVCFIHEWIFWCCQKFNTFTN